MIEPEEIQQEETKKIIVPLKMKKKTKRQKKKSLKRIDKMQIEEEEQVDVDDFF